MKVQPQVCKFSQFYNTNLVREIFQQPHLILVSPRLRAWFKVIFCSNMFNLHWVIDNQTLIWMKLVLLPKISLQKLCRFHVLSPYISVGQKLLYTLREEGKSLQIIWDESFLIPICIFSLLRTFVLLGHPPGKALQAPILMQIALISKNL